MEPGKQPTNERSRLPVYNEDRWKTEKRRAQQTLESALKIQNQTPKFDIPTPKCLVRIQQIQKYKQILFQSENSRQLEFYQPLRETKGWVRMNKRFAEKQRSKRREQIISKKGSQMQRQLNQKFACQMQENQTLN
ncbi:hypothetical protein OXYTRIMIC_327 [Oxytricha trifallax]|uniref:Uncharacterized protein n=1 Tax=Oxytricha trifallax TaxID=1172189 RepID=A0A073HZP0_9SPIT|nr:hypothetical protein OXYTRIMIC_327 [Oxytricha trifallax]